MADETIVLASFMHESNTFVASPPTTTRAAFRERGEYVGDEVVAQLRGTETVVGGTIDAAERRDVDLRPVLAASATPGAPVSAAAYDYYVGEILRGVDSHLDDLDGVMLGLHGAMVTEDRHDGEGHLLRRVRDLVGEAVPVSVSLDLHGNVSTEMMATADALNGFKTYPHLDRADAGRTGMNVLVDAVRGDVDPTMHVERPPQVVFQPRAYTVAGPMAELMDLAREYESRDGVLAASVFPGYYHADVPEMGVTTPVVTDGDEELAREVSQALARALWERRGEFVESYPGPDEAVEEAAAVASTLDADAGPVVMGDFGSNPGGGGASDGTTVARAFLEQSVANAGYAVMYDPSVVERAVSAGVGSTLTVTLGGKTDENHGPPIEDLEVYVKAIADGRFTNTGTSHFGHGVRNDIETTVHLACGPDRDLHVVVAGTRHSAFDAEVWRHVGIQPERLDVLCVPSFVAFLGDYEPLSSAVVLADTPGASAVDPARFEYEHRPRPLYPLEDLGEADWEPGP